MVAEQTRPDISFSGSTAKKELAEKAFGVIRAQGMFSSDYAPIRVKLDALAEFLGTSEAELRGAVDANSAVFSLEEDGETTYVASTRLGTTPIQMVVDNNHSFGARFLTPEAAPERLLRTEKPVPELVVNTEIGDAIEQAELETAQVEEAMRSEDGVRASEGMRVQLVSDEERAAIQEAAAARKAEAEAAAAAEQAEAEAPAEQAEAEAPAEQEHAAVVADVETEAEPAVDAEVEAEVEIDAETEVQAEVEVDAEAEIEAEAEPVVDAEVEVEPEAVVEAEPEVRMTDIGAYDDDAVAAGIVDALRSDSRVVNFGNSWMPEDRVERLSRGNLRSLAEYINEQEQPLTDDMLVQDVLGLRRSAPNFAAIRFSMNHRLSSERNFEFLGTADQPFWGTTDLPPIGTTRRKASDIGTDFRYLVDEVPADSVAPRSLTSVEHILSFYEFTYGLLPLDAQMQALLPGPMMPDQRSAVLMVEIPQFENSVYLVEVRYPTHNRGGFILGLDDFYEEKLVPGAMLSIEATGNDGQYKIEYLEDNEKQDRFLELDDRRAAKYVFRPLSYDTAVNDDWLVTENRFPRFGNEKPLSEKQRRRLEEVIEVTFQRIGDEDGGKWMATFTDLLVAVNVERPASEAVLRTALEAMASVSDDGSGILIHDSSA